MNVDFQEQDIIIEFTPEGQDGKSIRPRGDWSATAQYVELDLVSYQGSTYIAKKIVPVGTLPTDTEYWMINASNETPYWGTIAGTLSNQTDLQTALNEKADSADVYTKTETDNLLNAKADANSVYTKTETDDLLAAKADTDDVYTKTEADNLLAEKADADQVYTKSETDTLLSAKADASAVYTTNEVDTLLSAKADSDDVYTKAEADALLSDKADADTVYTKTETDTLLGAKADVGDSYTKTEEDALLAVKANSADVYTKTQADTLLASKADTDTVYTKTETDALLSAKADSSDVYTKTSVDTALALKADSADVYTKTATDALLLAKAPVILNSASGSIASFSDGSPAPVTALSVGIEPVQDLHGYDNPWPAGGGKNLLPLTVSEIKSLNTSGTWNGNAYTYRGITYTILFDSADNVIGINLNGTSTADWANFTLPNFSLSAGSYKLNGSTDGSSATYRIAVKPSGGSDIAQYSAEVPFTIDSDKSFTGYMTVRTSGTTVSNVKIYPMIRLASVTDATFSPYENVCPISGHTQAVVTRTGKNLYDGINANIYVKKLISADGTLTDNDLWVTTDYIIVKPTATYTLSCTIINAVGGLKVMQFDINKNPIGDRINISYTANRTKGTFTTAENCFFIRFSASKNQTTDIGRDLIATSQLELGSTATSYEPYQGTSVTIDLNGTRYGGVVDVLTGQMTVTKAIVDLGTLSWTKKSDNYFYSTGISTSTSKEQGNYGIANIICENYVAKSYSELNNGGAGIAINANGTIYVFDGNYNDTQTFTTAMSGVQLVYELATPLTVQLTENQIQTLLGQNAIWADTGDTEVTYRADSKMYIDQSLQSQSNALKLMLTPNVETEMKASKNYTSGSIVIVNNDFLKLTSAVASGANLVIGSNCAKTTMAEWVASLTT